MGIASLSFAASLPTYTSTGSNGTSFANNTLTTTGDVLVNTNDPLANGTPSVLASDFSANGLSYAVQGYSFSGNTLSVIYGLSDDASSAQSDQASDQSTALSDGIPGNVTDFTAIGGANTGSAITTNTYTATTEGVGTLVPEGQGSAISTSFGSGETLSLASISAGSNDTIDIAFTLSLPLEASATTASSSSGQTSNTAAVAPPSSTATLVSQLSGLPPPAGKAITNSLGIGVTTQSNNATAATISPGALLANFLNPSINQPVSIYSLISNIGVPQPASTVDLVA